MSVSLTLGLLLLLIFFFQGADSTKCYVCGGLSANSKACVDEYELKVKQHDRTDCKEVLGHTSGCVKSKYVDKTGRQIVTRSCAPEIGMTADSECKSTEVDGHSVWFCHCNDDFCNKGSNLNPSSTLLVALVGLTKFIVVH